MAKVSFYNKVFETKNSIPLEFDDYVNGIKEGKWQDFTFKYRSGKIKKNILPGITPSGVFSERKYNGLQQHSGIINLDLDQGHNEGVKIIDLRDEIYNDPYVLCGHLSVSGKGLTLYVKINPKKHLESYLALEKYFANTYNIILDPAAKDTPRFRYVSYDPDLHYNNNAKKWTTYLEKSKQPPKTYSEYIATESDFEFVMDQVTRKGINITEDYHDWIKAGFAIASKFGDAGRTYFHDISKISQKYDSANCDKKYDNIIKTVNSKISIGSFFWMAQNAGCEIKSKRTKKIESVAKIRMKQVGKGGGSETKKDARFEVIKYLKDVEKIEGDDVEQVLDQVEELKESDLKQKSDTDTKIDTCLHVINQNGCQFNKITGKLEANNIALTDNDLNSIFLDIIQIDDTIKKDFFLTIINSNRIKQFDPFLRFIEKYKHLRPEGNIDKLLDTLKDRMLHNEDLVKDYKQIYVRKWLLSIMASIHGTYSLMILVLTGKQMIQKTNWFRNILPNELKKYYAESKLDAGKDDEILMTEKLIIVDDEFGGKSKQEAKKLKDLSSKQYFSIRRPYGRIAEDIRRIAVLGGTSNDDEVLNDPTGNRRIIPLKVENIDMEAFKKIDNIELFIEIYHEWIKTGDGWMLTAEEVKWLNNTTLLHEQDVLEYQLIQKYYTSDESHYYQISSTDVKVYLEHKTGQKLSLYKIGQSLTKLGYKKKAIKKDGNVKQSWGIQERM